MKKLLSILIILQVLVLCCSGPGGKAGNNRLQHPDSILIEDIFPLQQQHCHGSSITALPDKSLLAVWFQGSGERTADDVIIMGSRFSPRTGTWCKPFIMADVPGFPDINPVVFVDNKSRLWLVWYTVLAYQWQSSILKYRLSENYMQPDSPPEWKWQDLIHVRPDSSSPEGIGRNDGYVKTLEKKYSEYHAYLSERGLIGDQGKGITEELWNKAVQGYLDIAKGMNLVNSGTDIDENGEKIKKPLGYPLMRRIGWQTRNKPLLLGDSILLPLYSDGFDFSLVAITGDYGQSWSFSEPLVGACCVQPALLECTDNTVIAYMRDNGPPPQRMMMSRSGDRGRSWSTVEDSEIPNPGTAADICRLESGNWVLVHNDVEEGRHRLSAWLSEDEGKSWPHRAVIREGAAGSLVRVHYPAVIQSEDGLIHVSFTNQAPLEKENSSARNICHAVLTEEYLLKK